MVINEMKICFCCSKHLRIPTLAKMKQICFVEPIFSVILCLRADPGFQICLQSKRHECCLNTTHQTFAGGVPLFWLSCRLSAVYGARLKNATVSNGHRG